MNVRTRKAGSKPYTRIKHESTYLVVSFHQYYFELLLQLNLIQKVFPTALNGDRGDITAVIIDRYSIRLDLEASTPNVSSRTGFNYS